MGAISGSEICVVIQGPIVGSPTDRESDRVTAGCLRSLRKHLPGARLILSTWKGSNVDGLDFDEVVYSEDPGGFRFGYRYKPSMLNNVNRQIVSTMAGLERADRKYVLKFRSDMTMTHGGMLSYFGKYTDRSPQMKVAKERVLACTVYSRDPRLRFQYPFHPSDFVFFGLLEDVRDIWSAPLFVREDFEWFRDRVRPWPDFDSENYIRYVPEQHIWLSYLRKHLDVDVCEYMWDTRDDAIRASEISIANNLVLLTPKQLGIVWMKKKISARDWFSIYTNGDWHRMYREHCSPQAAVGMDVVKLWRYIELRRRGSLRRAWGVIRMDFIKLYRELRRSIPTPRFVRDNPFFWRIARNYITHYGTHAYNLVFKVWGKRIFVNGPKKVLRKLISRGAA